jgi:hypothetical protein
MQSQAVLAHSPSLAAFCSTFNFGQFSCHSSVPANELNPWVFGCESNKQGGFGLSVFETLFPKIEHCTRGIGYASFCKIHMAHHLD